MNRKTQHKSPKTVSRSSRHRSPSPDVREQELTKKTVSRERTLRQKSPSLSPSDRRRKQLSKSHDRTRRKQDHSPSPLRDNHDESDSEESPPRKRHHREASSHSSESSQSEASDSSSSPASSPEPDGVPKVEHHVDRRDNSSRVYHRHDRGRQEPDDVNSQRRRNSGSDRSPKRYVDEPDSHPTRARERSSRYFESYGRRERELSHRRRRSPSPRYRDRHRRAY